MFGRIAILLGAALALTGCAHHKRARGVPPPPPPAVVRPGYTEMGVASWYGNPYHGRPAANGEIYDMEKMTAAHRTLPFNTWVRVYDLDNRRNTEVRITDRGPFIDGRIIDLSRAAARELSMIGPGIAHVRIEVIRAPDVITSGFYAVQVGAFRSRDAANRLRILMQSEFGNAQLQERSSDNPHIWRVLVGAESTEQAAKALADKIRQNSSLKADCFVVRIDAI